MRLPVLVGLLLAFAGCARDWPATGEFDTSYAEQAISQTILAPMVAFAS